MALRKLTLMVVLVATIGGTLGSVSASATTRITCGAGVTCAPGQAFNGQSPSGFTLTDNLGNLHCSAATINGTIGSNPSAGSTVSLTVTNVHLSGCIDTTELCNIASTMTTGTVSWSATINDASMTINGATLPITWQQGPCAYCPDGTFTCDETCNYGASSITGSVSGSTATFNNVPVSLQSGMGGYCPTPASFDMAFTLRTGTTPGSGTLITVDTL